MGRPINKRYLGSVVNGSLDGNFTAIVKVGANAVVEAGYIVSQRSETLFVVNDGVNQGACRLVNKVIPGDNEMVIRGARLEGDDVNIRKLQNRTVIDFDNNVYTWEIQDDSTANILVLTQI
jgi:hypothetical protein